jgi:tetratricopeptide (TPR) repeat protein
VATDYAPVVEEARLRLASARGRQGEPDAAIDLASAAYFSARIRRNDAGAADAALLLSWLLYDADQYDAALSWVRHARATLPNDAGPSLRTAIAARREASIRLARDEIDLAERLARDALTMLRGLEDPHEIEVATTLSVLGMLARQRGDEQATVELLSEAVELAEGVYGDQHSAVQSRLTSLGLALTEVGEYERAGQALERSLRLAVKLYGADSRFTASAKRALGHAMRHLGKYDRARALFTEALEWDSAHHGPTDPLRGHDLRGLALLASAEGKPDEAVALLEEVLRLWDGNRVSSAFVGHAELELARALHATQGDAARVHALAEAAAARYESYGEERADDAASARAFLAQLGAPAEALAP